MSGWLGGVIDGLLRRPWSVIAVLLALGAAAASLAVRVEQENAPEVFFSADEEARARYHALVEVFGADELVLFQLRGARPRPADLAALHRLRDQVASLSGVRQVFSPTDGYLVASPGEKLEVEPETARRVRDEVAAAPLYRALGLYRRAPPLLGVAALLEPMEGAAARQRLARQVTKLEQQVARELAPRGICPLVAGLSLANAAIDREARRSINRYLPLVVVLGLLVALLLFRSLRAALAIVVPVGVTAAAGVAGLALAGESLNMVTGVMPSLVLAVGFAGAIHLVAHYAACCSAGELPFDAARRTVREKLAPTAFAFGTTAAGFGSLGLSSVQTVRVLGLAAGGSLLLAGVLVTVGTPAMLLALGPRLRVPARRRELLERVAGFAARRRWTVIGVALALSGLAAAGFSQLRRVVDGMDLLPATSAERAAYQRLEREGVGLGNVDLWIRPARENPATKVAARRALLADARRLAAVAKELDGAPLVTATVGVHDLLAVAGYRLNGRAEVPASLLAFEITATAAARRALEARLARFWHPTRGLKLTLLTKTGDEHVLAEQRRRALAAARRHFPGAEVEVSGHFTLLIGTPGALMGTMTESLALTAGVVALLLLVFFRSLWLTLGGMAGNLLPVALVLGAMGWLGIAVDVATVMTASVAFGIAVDDTFHYLYHRRRSGSIFAAARIAGQGILASSLVIGGGFAVLGVSGFAPVARFGLLIAAAVVAALLVDALLLPALLAPRAERGARASKSTEQ